MKAFPTNEHHKALKADLDALTAKYADKMTDAEVLAIISQVVGMVIALQDQRTMTPDQAMSIVAANIEVGNQLVVNNLRDAPAGRRQ